MVVEARCGYFIEWQRLGSEGPYNKEGDVNSVVSGHPIDLSSDGNVVAIADPV